MVSRNIRVPYPNFTMLIYLLFFLEEIKYKNSFYTFQAVEESFFHTFCKTINMHWAFENKIKQHTNYTSYINILFSLAQFPCRSASTGSL